MVELLQIQHESLYVSCQGLFAASICTNSQKCREEIAIFSTAGMLCVALTPTLQLAAVCSAYLYSLFNLFAGFAITQPNMPGWWYAPVAVCLTVMVAQFLHICL